MPRFSRITGLIAVFALASACSLEDESTASMELNETEPVSEQRAGSLLVEYNARQAAGLSVHAQFIEVRGVSPEAAFEALDAWSPDVELDADTCSIRSVETGEGTGAVHLHMLDVGPISVTVPNHAIRLDGRRVPDLQSFSGVVYGNEEGFDLDEAFLPYEPLMTYQISAPGSEHAGGFGVSLLAPMVPEIEMVAGQYAVDDAPIPLQGDELELQWRAEPDGRTRLFLDIESGGQRLQCHLEDDGQFVVPLSALEGFSERIQLRLRRVDAIRMDVDGADEGSFVFAATDEATVLR